MSAEIDLKVRVFPKEDPRLGWVSMHDPASEEFPVRAKLRRVAPDTPKAYNLGAVLDQGQEGSCVGHGWTGELLASPKPDPYTDSRRGHEYAVGLYKRAQQIDEWDGEGYDGTSVLAGAKVVLERGFHTEYRWCFSIEDVRDAVIAEGPVVIGIPWHDTMYDTRPSGLVEVGGSIVGGHCLLITGYHPAMRIAGEDYHERFKVFRWRNSWGPSYGKNGNGFIRWEDLRDLLKNAGEACVPIGRKSVRLSA